MPPSSTPPYMPVPLVTGRPLPYGDRAVSGFAIPAGFSCNHREIPEIINLQLKSFA